MGLRRFSTCHASLPILPHPPGPGWLRTCPDCGTRRSLLFERREPHPILDHVDTYRCKACHRTFEFGGQLPRYAI